MELWEEFVSSIPSGFSAILELFDAIPKFYAGAVTDRRLKRPLDIVSREFRWAKQEFRVEIKPVIIRDKTGRKEILAGEREETVYRVLRKMASDRSVERSPLPVGSGADVPGVAMSFSLYDLRKRCAEIGRGFKASEIRESLEVLAQTPMKVTNETLRREIYAGPYIGLEYIQDTDNNEDGQRTLIKVTFNRLATVAIMHGMFDRVNYGVLMSLKISLAQWLYETIVRQFRQARVDLGYSITLLRIMRESPMREYKELRKAGGQVDRAINEMVEKGVIASFPPPKREVIYEETNSRGRPPVQDIRWTLFLTEQVVREIRSDNADRVNRTNGGAEIIDLGGLPSRRDSGRAIERRK